MAFWFVLNTTTMNDFARAVYCLFLPLTATPYIMFVIHKEGQKSYEYWEGVYGGHAGFAWVARIFMMVVVSALSSVAALLIFGAVRFIVNLF